MKQRTLGWISLMSVCIAGCAPMRPMTPEQAAYMQRALAEQQRQQNALAIAQIQAISNNRPNYQPPAQMAMPVQRGVAAVWTGRSEPATSVTGVSGVNCEFDYAGQRFWRMFAGGCPSKFQVQ